MAPAGFGDSVEGFHAVAAAAAAGRVIDLWIERHRLRRGDYLELSDIARGYGARIHEVDDVLARAETAAPQGVVAQCRQLFDATLEDLAARVAPAAVIVLDHVLDPHNVGAIARSVAGAGLGGMIVAGRRAAPLSATAFKAAAGAFEHLPVARVNSIADTVARLQKLGLWGLGLEGSAAEEIWDQPLLAEPMALVVGEEGGGLSRLVRDRVDLLVRIPLAPGTESLNVSVAAALAAFEVVRLRSGR